MRREFVVLLGVLCVVLSATRAQAQLTLAETGGTFDTPNLATQAGAVAFAPDVLGNGALAAHQIVHINDGVYGNDSSWIGEAAVPAYVAVRLAAPATVASVAWGRDNTGGFMDRASGLFDLQYTTVANPDESTPAGDWVSVGTVTYDAAFPPAPWLRHRFNFVAVNNVTAIRLVVPFTGIGSGTAIDELEVYSDPFVPPSPPLTLVEEGGTFGDGNLAKEEGAVAFASDVLGSGSFPAHQIAHLNDCVYGNDSSWIGDAIAPAFVGIALAGPRTVAAIAWGRDNTSGFVDRALGPYEVQYTLVDSPDAATPSEDWTTIGTVNYVAGSPPVPHLRHRWDFEPIENVTAVRVIVPLTGIAGGTAVDEVEIYAENLTIECPNLDAAITGGPITTPAAPGDVPDATDGNLARGTDAVAFATPSHPAPVHEIAHLNDGSYGNSSSWLGEFAGETSGDVYAGIYFTEGVKSFFAVALGRDNTGVFVDRIAGAYRIEMTVDSFDPTSDAAVDAANWTCIGFADDHLTDGVGHLRHVYCGPALQARAIRVLTQQGNVIDELEVLGTSPGPELTLAEIGGSFADGNLATADGATAFATEALLIGGQPVEAHMIAHLNDGLYGNDNSWIGNSGTFATGNPGFVGIAFGGVRTVASIAFGRDNGGEEMELIDRTAGTYILQRTQVASPGADTPDCDWETVGHTVYGAFCPPVPWLRHRFDFAPVEATGIRIIVPGIGLAGGTAIDELEVYSVASGAVIDCVVPEPLELISLGGPQASPGVGGDVPSLAAGNVARAADAISFATPPHPAPVHEIAFLNDGSYGNNFSWLGNEPGPASGEVYAGIYFADAMRVIHEIGLGRDNTAGFNDRSVGAHRVQYTTDTFDPTDDEAAAGADWIDLGLADAHLSDASPLRHRYRIPPTEVRAVRVLTALGNVFDEIELLVPQSQIGGDCNQDGTLNVADVVCMIGQQFPSFILTGTPPSPCPGPAGNLAVLNVNGDAGLDLSDIMYLANHLFGSGPGPMQGDGCFVMDDAFCDANVTCAGEQ